MVHSAVLEIVYTDMSQEDALIDTKQEAISYRAIYKLAHGVSRFKRSPTCNTAIFAIHRLAALL